MEPVTKDYISDQFKKAFREQLIECLEELITDGTIQFDLDKTPSSHWNAANLAVVVKIGNTKTTSYGVSIND